MSEISTSPATAVATAATDNGGSQQSAATAVASTSTASSTTAQTSAVAEPWFKSWIKDDGSVDAKAYERLPDDLKHLAPSLANAKNVDEIMRKMANLNTLAGKKGLAALPADAPPDAVKARNELMRQINGVPEKAADYGIVRPENVPAEQWNQSYLDTALGIMHKFNTPPAMVKELVALNMQTSQVQQQQEAEYEKNFYATQQKEIQSQLSKDGVQYDKALDLAERTARTFGIDPQNDAIFKNAKVFLALSKVGVALGEPRLVTGETSGNGGGPDDGARAQDIIHNKANPENAAYWNAEHPNNKAVKAKVLQWQAESARKAQATRQAAGGARR
jgi:hypothetical protein